jgi:hypothetical protein
MRIRGVERSVTSFLQGEKNWLCNRCIARITSINEHEIRYVTRRLQYAHRYYVQTPDISCSSCSAPHLCIRALES